MNLDQIRQQVLMASVVLFTGLMTGCGGSTPPAEQAAVPATAPPAAPAAATQSPAAAPATSSTASTSAAPGAVDPQRLETKWIGNIPYDVFYDQPLNIATDTTTVGVASPNAVAKVDTPSSTPAAMTPAATTPAAGSSGGSTSSTTSQVNWAEIIPMPILIEEVKLLRTDLTGNLQTVATFNKSQKETALDGAILAAMSCIVIAHPEDTTWKPNAHFVRDLAAEINFNSSGTGRGPFTMTKEPFEKLLVILNGGKPPEMDSPEVVPFSEVVYVADIMQRIDKTFTNLKANVNTEARLKENPADAEREMRILLALATMMTDSSYDLAAEKNYQAFLKRFTDGAKEGVQAIQTKNFEGFLSGLNQIQTTCAECHQEYKSSGSGF